MTRGPVPPHERAWRHPSELAAPPHEPTSRLGHLLIASTATIGLVLVGVLVLSMTPDQVGAPDESIIDSTDIVVIPNSASGDRSTASGGKESVVNNVLRAVSTLLTATTTSPVLDTDPENPIEPTGTVTTSVISPPGQVAPSDPPVALIPVDSSQSSEPSNALPSTTDLGAPASDPVVSSFDSALAAQAESTVADSQSGVGVPPGATDSTQPLALLNLALTTSSTTSTVPGQSTTSTSTTTSSSSSTTAPATSTTLASQVKQLG